MKKIHDLETRVVGVFIEVQLAWPFPSKHVGGVLLGLAWRTGTEGEHEKVRAGDIWSLTCSLSLTFLT